MNPNLASNKRPNAASPKHGDPLTSSASQSSRMPNFTRSGTYVIERKEFNAASNSSSQIPKNPQSKLTKIQSSCVKAQPNSASSLRSSTSSIETISLSSNTNLTQDKKIDPPKAATAPSSSSNLALIKEKKRAELKEKSKASAKNNEPEAAGAHLTPLSRGVEVLLKNARKSGQLNLSDAGLAEIPGQIWNLNSQDIGVSKSVSLEAEENDFKWWDQVDLNKLILASNKIKSIPKDVRNLSSLVTLDVICVFIC